MESRNNGGKKLMVILIIILSIISIGSLGYIIYDKVIDDNKSSNNVDTDEKQNDDNKGSNDVSTNEKEVKVEVATEYEYSVYARGISQKSETEKEGTTLFKVKLPKIVNGTLDAEKLNKKMLADASKNVADAVKCREELYPCFGEGLTTSYEYLIKNNVLAIYIYESTPSGNIGVGTSGNGLDKSIYFYNIKTGKIIDKISEAARLMEIKDLGEVKNYSDLDNCGTIDYSIKNGVLSINASFDQGV